MFGKSSCSDKCFGGHCRGGLGWDFVSLVVDLSFFAGGGIGRSLREGCSGDLYIFSSGAKV